MHEAGSTAEAADRVPAVGLDVVFSSEAVRATKLARIHRCRKGVTFMSVFGTRCYDVDAQATCSRGVGHVAPAVNCRCGFYALRTDADLCQLLDGASMLNELVVLDVDLTGTVIEATNGYRASGQRVLGVTVSDRCSRCDEPAVAVKGNLSRNLVPCCRRHRNRRSLTVGELASELGTEVGFGAVGPHRQKFTRSRFILIAIHFVLFGLFVGGALAVVGTMHRHVHLFFLFAMFAGLVAPIGAELGGLLRRTILALTVGGAGWRAWLSLLPALSTR